MHIQPCRVMRTYFGPMCNYHKKILKSMNITMELYGVVSILPLFLSKSGSTAKQTKNNTLRRVIGMMILWSNPILQNSWKKEWKLRWLGILVIKIKIKKIACIKILVRSNISKTMTKVVWPSSMTLILPQVNQDLLFTLS